MLRTLLKRAWHQQANSLVQATACLRHWILAQSVHDADISFGNDFKDSEGSCYVATPRLVKHLDALRFGGPTYVDCLRDQNGAIRWYSRNVLLRAFACSLYT